MEKKFRTALQEAKELLCFYKKVSKLEYVVHGYQCKLLTTSKEYLRKGKIKFKMVNFKCKYGKDINVVYPLCKNDQEKHINLEQHLQKDHFDCIFYSKKLVYQ